MSKKIEHKWIDGVKCKRCGHCKEWKPLDCFCKNKNRWDGLRYQCRNCQEQYRVDNAEKIKKWKKQYRLEHVEEIKKQKKQYYLNYIEERKQCSKQYHIEHIEQRKQYNNRSALYETYADQLFWCEEVRQDGEFLGVKCAYCGKWMLPTNLQVQNRISAINSKGSGEHRFYCSENCKRACPIYHQKLWPKGFKQATSREVVPLLRQLVLERDNWTCQKCWATTETAQLHVHHIVMYAQNKMQANDPDSCITLCKSCHKEIHLQDGCKYHELKCGENKNV